MFSALNRRVKKWIIAHHKRQPLVLISDTTLRDGAQMPGVRLTLDQKQAIVRMLASSGIRSIELGFPAIGPGEVEHIRALASTVRGPILSALSRTLPADIAAAAEALAPCPILRRAITLFIGTSPIHREDKLRMSKSEVIEVVVNSIQRAAAAFQIISVGAEDASRTEPGFLCELYREAIAAGATSIGFTDTVGVLTPQLTRDYVQRIQQDVPNFDDALLAVHFHDDLGLATANSLAAIKAGANIVQGTINGIGERAGNVALEEVVLALALHPEEFGRTTTVNLAAISALSACVSEATGVPVPANKPVVGGNLFRTAAGIHQDGLLKNPETYLPYPPELVGAGPVELVLSEKSGRGAVRHYLKEEGLPHAEAEVAEVLSRLKAQDR